MGQQHGPWLIQKSEEMYCDPWVRLQRDQVIRPDGNPGTYATVQLRSGVCVIARDESANIHLTKEFHYAVGRDTIEGVSGGIEDGEEIETAAKRELEEELGLIAEKWTHLGKVDPFTAAIHSTVDLFLAEELSQGIHSPEGTELIEHVTMPEVDAVAAVRDGRITHTPTCIALMNLALGWHGTR